MGSKHTEETFANSHLHGCITADNFNQIQRFQDKQSAQKRQQRGDLPVLGVQVVELLSHSPGQGLGGQVAVQGPARRPARAAVTEQQLHQLCLQPPTVPNCALRGQGRGQTVSPTSIVGVPPAPL